MLRHRSTPAEDSAPPAEPLAGALDWLEEELAALEDDSLRRSRVVREGPAGPWVTIDGQRLVSFASNDYLGLAGDPRLTAAAVECARRLGWGAAASPLLAGHDTEVAQLERELAAWTGTEAALVLGSGYATNLAVLTALAGREDVIFSDAWNHASLIDGCRLSRARVVIYPHGDARELARLLAREPGRRRLIVTDSLFSMDGDVAPLAELVELAVSHRAMLVVDEAHATGVLGPRGTGLAEELGVAERVDVRIGTLSKALGSSGGFVAGRRSLIDWLVNRARSYIFSTAPPPACAAASRAALAIVRDEPARRSRLAELTRNLRARLAERGWQLGVGASQIVPVVVGDSARALALSARLRGAGYYVPAIRPPSVPLGTARLRISLSAAHTPEQIEGLVTALGQPEASGGM